MIKIRFLFYSVSFFTVSLSAVTSSALFYNNTQYLIGDRAAGMGGAYVAPADDSSSLWYNPAGLANITDSSINISANSYSYFNMKWPSKECSTDTETQAIDINLKDRSINASTMLYGFRLREGEAIAFGILIPYQYSVNAVENVHLNGTGGSVYEETSAVVNSKFYMAIAGYGKKITNRLGIGVSMGTGYNMEEDEFSMRGYISAGTDEVYSLTMHHKKEEYAVQGSAGLQFIPAENSILGLYFQSPCFRITGYDNTRTTMYAENTAAEKVHESEDKDLDSFGEVYPGHISAGYSYQVPESWAVSIEATVVFRSEEAENIIINYRSGVEYYILRQLVLRAGFFTDFSQLDKLTLNSEYTERTDYFGGSLAVSLLSEQNSGDSKGSRRYWTTLGLTQREGFGKTQYEIADYSNLAAINRYYVLKDMRYHITNIYLSETVVF